MRKLDLYIARHVLGAMLGMPIPVVIGESLELIISEPNLITMVSVLVDFLPNS